MGTTSSTGRTQGPLSREHDLVMFDLDGVLYVGDDAVPGAVEAVARLREEQTPVAFVTNNASRTPDTVAERLTGLGMPAVAEDVVTSAQAAARVLLERHGPGARVLLLGGEGLEVALREAGLVPVTDAAEPDLVALATGYGPEVLWRDIMRAASAVRDGLPWVASNTDLTIPTAYGTAPGHGVLVRTIADFAGVEAVVAGKPERPLMEETMRRMGGERALFVGDRLDTDIAGARAVDVPSLLVMTGVSGLDDLVAAVPELRPTYIAADLAGLAETHVAPSVTDSGSDSVEDSVELGGWAARIVGDALEVDGSGGPGDWWRVVAVAAWRHLDEVGTPPRVDELRPPTDG